MATSNDLKNGLVLNIDGQLWSVVEFQHVKPGKGPAFVRTKLKNVLSGKVVDKTFNAGGSMLIPKSKPGILDTNDTSKVCSAGTATRPTSSLADPVPPAASPSDAPSATGSGSVAFTLIALTDCYPKLSPGPLNQPSLSAPNSVGFQWNKALASSPNSPTQRRPSRAGLRT